MTALCFLKVIIAKPKDIVLIKQIYQVIFNLDTDVHNLPKSWLVLHADLLKWQ